MDRLLEHGWQISRIILPVAVKRADPFATCRLESTANGRALSAVDAVINGAYLWILDLSNDTCGRVRAGVVDQNQFKAARKAGQCGNNFIGEGNDVFFFIVGR